MDLSIVTTLYRSEKYVREFCPRAPPPRRHSLTLRDRLRQRRLAGRVAGPRARGSAKTAACGSSTCRETSVTIKRSSRDCNTRPAPWSFWSIRIWKRIPPGCSTSIGRSPSTGADVVYGVQKRRRGGFFERVTGNVAYSIYHALLDHDSTECGYGPADDAALCGAARATP